MATPLISVIVPVYNVETYLPQCIESLLNQKYQNLELLLIDDGSSDGSGAICDRYERLDKRVKAFHKENGGVSSARNLGLDHACGEWIAYVDSDDYVSPDYLQDLYTALQPGTDLVIERFRMFRDDGKKSLVDIDTRADKISIYEKSQIRKLNVEQELQIRVHSFSKLFRTSIISNSKLYYDERFSFAEDYLFLYKYLDLMEGNVVCTSAANLFYRERDCSLVHRGPGDFNKSYSLYLTVKGQICAFSEKYHCDLHEFDVAYFLHRALMMATSINQLKRITREDWIFFLEYFKVITRKTKNDKFMVKHFRSRPFVLLGYIKFCRGLRNMLARTNLWGILDTLKK